MMSVPEIEGHYAEAYADGAAALAVTWRMNGFPIVNIGLFHRRTLESTVKAGLHY